MLCTSRVSPVSAINLSRIFSIHLDLGRRLTVSDTCPRFQFDKSHIVVDRQAVFFERRLIAQRSVHALRHRARLECFSHAGLALYVDIYRPAVAGPNCFEGIFLTVMMALL